MSETHRTARGTRESSARWPPELVELIRERAPGYEALASVPDAAIERLLSTVFFASLQSEELERHPIRVAFVGARSSEAIPAASDAAAVGYDRWRALRFRRAPRFDVRHLVKLARAASTERLFSMVALVDDELEIVGLAREGVRSTGSAVLKIVAPSAGALEVWCGSTRVLEYVRGVVQQPAENLLLAAGPVRRALESFAREERVSQGYVSAVALLVRFVAAHGYGGILVVCAERDPLLAEEEGFVTETDIALCALLRQVRRDDLGDTASTMAREELPAEIERTIAETSRLSALDGATILDRSLAVRGFGVVVPITPHVIVVEALDAEGQRRVDFALDRRGARHHAAASYASSHVGSVVFAASADGEIACMLRESSTSPVVLWRFHPFEAI